MSAKSLEDRLAAAAESEKKLKAAHAAGKRKMREKEAALAEKRKRLLREAAARERKLETRRNIIVGAMVRKRADDDPAAADRLRRRLDRTLTRRTDRDLFGLPPPEGPEDAAPDIGGILERLAGGRVRATYGAVAGVLGVTPRDVGPLLGGRSRENSWVVNAATGEPAGYAPHQIAPGLKTRREIIADAAELREFCRSGRLGPAGEQDGG